MIYADLPPGEDSLQIDLPLFEVELWRLLTLILDASERGYIFDTGGEYGRSDR